MREVKLMKIPALNLLEAHVMISRYEEMVWEEVTRGVSGCKLWIGV